jgi:endogenous inhibitor of DNA gyrase (YacG/DUF329 family)
MSKYVNKRRNIVSCPSCRGVVVRDLEENKHSKVVSFFIRCPHCQEDVRVEMRGAEISINLKTNKKKPS